MSKEGTFEYQRDLYARMIIELVVNNGDRLTEFGKLENAISVNECTAMVCTVFDVRMDVRWIDVLVREYPDVFSFDKVNSSTAICIDKEAAKYLEI